jgi:transposase
VVFGKEYHFHVQEVIPMKSKAYRAMDVNRVEIGAWLEERGNAAVQVGLDMGKELIFCTLRWGDYDFDRPWRVRNPSEVRRLADLLKVVGQGRQMVVAMEPTGTYGDAMRQALERLGLEVHRVSPKSASDFAEMFDGVPSQHDGKDAAVIAELASQGRSWAWPMPRATEAEQELAFQVEWLDGQRRQMMLWCGRLEALLSRHWPEATRVLPLCSATLLNCLRKYGGPSGLGSAADGLKQVQAWGGSRLTEEKAHALIEGAQQTVGVVMGSWDQERLRRYAEQIQNCQREMRAVTRRLCALTKGHTVIAGMGEVVGVPTACVLWKELGDPRSFHCGAAYRKAMGLNLAERSSGKWKGKLKISKRGSSAVRRWLYLAALRWVREEPVHSWYVRQKGQRRGEAKPAVIAVMRKLALALYQVGGRGKVFDRKQLYVALTSSAAESAPAK